MPAASFMGKAQSPCVKWSSGLIPHYGTSENLCTVEAVHPASHRITRSLVYLLVQPQLLQGTEVGSPPSLFSKGEYTLYVSHWFHTCSDKMWHKAPLLDQWFWNWGPQMFLDCNFQKPSPLAMLARISGSPRTSGEPSLRTTVLD